MITFIIGLLLGAAIGCGLHYGAEVGIGWSSCFGFVGFAAFQVILGRILKKRVTADMERVQVILSTGQKALQQKMQRWQMRPPGSLKQAQNEMAADTRIFVKAALDQTDTLNKYRLWVPLMARQIATAKLQLCWMIKDFKSVDMLMPKVLIVDPTMAAMKLARMQMLNAPLKDMEKFYKKQVRRLKYNQNVLLAGCYTWILVHRGEVDAAFKALTEALKNSDNATLKRNHECLMNNRVAHFTNSGLGDQWYSLLLEEPRVRTQRQHPVYR